MDSYKKSRWVLLLLFFFIIIPIFGETYKQLFTVFGNSQHRVV